MMRRFLPLPVLFLISGLILVTGLTLARAQQSIPAATNTISITGTVAASTKIISGVSGRYLYITSLNLVPVATSVVTFTAGTGTNCGTNTTSLSGAMTFATGQILQAGTGAGVILAAPQGYDICITIATAVSPGFLSYSLF